MPPIDPGQAFDFIRDVGVPGAIAVFLAVLAAAALWFQDRARRAEIARLQTAHKAELGRAWDMFRNADDERKANGRELAEQLKTLDIALELVQRSARS